MLCVILFLLKDLRIGMDFDLRKDSTTNLSFTMDNDSDTHDAFVKWRDGLTVSERRKDFYSIRYDCIFSFIMEMWLVDELNAKYAD